MAKEQKLTLHSANELRAVELVAQALELPPDRQRAFLEEKLSREPELRALVFEILDDPSPLETFLESSPVPRPVTVPAEALSPPHLDEGERIADFVVKRVLGRGGFATVHLATQVSLRREVALKVCRDRGREAEILAQLDHDNIVKVYSQTVDKERGLSLICMQYVPGTTLADVISSWSRYRALPDGRSILDYVRDQCSVGGSTGEQGADAGSPIAELDFQESALWIGSQLASALAYAHERGVLHLDVKPSNVLLNPRGRPFLTDFNVSLDARAAREAALGLLGGTLRYMSPEQKELIEAVDKTEAIARIGPRSDIYSLGIVIKEFLWCALRPETPARTTSRHTSVLKDLREAGEDLPVSKAWRLVDAGVRFAVDKCTEREPSKRFATAEEAAKAFESCLEMREIMKTLARPGLFLSAATRFPRLALTVSWLLPYLLATAISAIDLATAFPGSISKQDEKFFPFLIGVGATYLALIFLWITRLGPLGRGQMPSGRDPGKGARRALLRLPAWILLFATWLWLPGMIVAFFWKILAPDPLIAYRTGHLLLPVVLSGLVAAGYSTLFMTLIILRAIYPRFWLGSSEIRQSAARELANLRSHLRASYLLVACAPLAAAILVFLDPAEPVISLKVLIPGLLAASLGGVLIDAVISHRVAAILYAFAPGRSERTRRQR